MVPKVIEYHFAKASSWQLHSLTLSPLVSCVYFTIVLMTAELLNQPVQPQDGCFQRKVCEKWSVSK